jgi:hypothetical protein
MSLWTQTPSSIEFKYFPSLTKPLKRYGEIFADLLGSESLLQVLEHSDAIRGITMLP